MQMSHCIKVSLMQEFFKYMMKTYVFKVIKVKKPDMLKLVLKFGHNKLQKLDLHILML